MTLGLKLSSMCFVWMPLALIFVISCSSNASCQDHGHGHDHHGHAHDDMMPASFKYSRAANEPSAADEHHHQEFDDLHDHDHYDHDHHDDHGHSHDDHHSHDHHGHSHDDHAHSHSHAPPPKRAQTQTHASSEHSDHGLWLWIKAIGSTALVSAAPVFILLVIPLENANEQQPLLKVLLSFASGGLLGDAFLHLIPHAMSPHSHGEDGGHEHTHSHSHGDGGHDLSVGLWVLFGIVAFLAVEKFVRYVKGSGHGHSHGHAGDAKMAVGDKKEENKEKKEKKAKDSDEDEPPSSKEMVVAKTGIDLLKLLYFYRHPTGLMI